VYAPPARAIDAGAVAVTALEQPRVRVRSQCQGIESVAEGAPVSKVIGAAKAGQEGGEARVQEMNTGTLDQLLVQVAMPSGQRITSELVSRISSQSLGCYERVWHQRPQVRFATCLMHHKKGAASGSRRLFFGSLFLVGRKVTGDSDPHGLGVQPPGHGFIDLVERDLGQALSALGAGLALAGIYLGMRASAQQRS